MTLWGGRFDTRLDPAAWALNASIGFDRRLARQDVRGSQAWADGLLAAGVLSQEDTQAIKAGLQAVDAEFEAGTFVFVESDEDIHTAVERRLGELIGPTAGKLHTGRSRNDQVATDLRLWLMEALPVVDASLADLQKALLERAEAAGETLLPGYTHLQRAQPVLLSHWWLAHFWPLQRDRERLAQASQRTAQLPLGSGALAGAPFPVDRSALAKALGFAGVCPDSIDAVSDRDFAAEFLAIAALVGVHISHLAEQVVLFTSAEFGYFELSDAYSTGSSLMPQKKNPDPFELARGKAGMLIGLQAGLLATLKGLPSAYDKDLQEDKIPLFQAYDTLTALLPVLAGAVRTLTVNPDRMRRSIDAAMLATDLADYLVAKGVPFRDAHALTGKAVRQAVQQGVSLDALPLEAYKQISEKFEPDLSEVFDPARSAARRTAAGGTSPSAVADQIQAARATLA